MAIQYVTYLTKAYLACADCLPFDAILELDIGVAAQRACFDANVDTWPYETLVVSITQVVKQGTLYEYTLEYESDLVTNPTLDPATIRGMACYGPLAKYIKDLAGFDPTITINEDGTYTFQSSHGCNYVFGQSGGLGNVVVADTASIDLTSLAGVLSADLILSPDLGNSLVVRPNGLYGSAGWSVSGNAGTIDGTNFLGTLDNVAFDIRVGNERAYRFFPHAASSASITGGYHSNSISNLAIGALIAGGGYSGNINRILAGNFSSIGGGALNTINDSLGGVIGGGYGNNIQGTTLYGYVGGGTLNTVKGDYSIIVGGKQNNYPNISTYGFIGGGNSNSLDGIYSAIVGGTGQRILAGSSASFIGGGAANTLTGNDSAIGGGNTNNIFGDQSVIGGGVNNIMGLSATPLLANQSVIGGGEANQIQSSWASIAGGQQNLITEHHGFIGGGFANSIAAGMQFAVVGGGYGNNIRNSTAGSYSAATIAGGHTNVITTSDFSFIGGGQGNSVNFGHYNSILAGSNNNISGGQFNVIAGGYTNSIIGGSLVAASFIAGSGQLRVGNGTFAFQSLPRYAGTHGGSLLDAATIFGDNVAYFGDVDVIIGNTLGNIGYGTETLPGLKLYSANNTIDYTDSGSAHAKYTKLQAHPVQTEHCTLLMPRVGGNVGDQLSVETQFVLSGSKVHTLTWDKPLSFADMQFANNASLVTLTALGQTSITGPITLTIHNTNRLCPVNVFLSYVGAVGYFVPNTAGAVKVTVMENVNGAGETDVFSGLLGANDFIEVDSIHLPFNRVLSVAAGATTTVALRVKAECVLMSSGGSVSLQNISIQGSFIAVPS